MARQNAQITVGVADRLVQRLQAAGLELQRALPLVDNDEARAQIESAVERLNDAIKTVYLAAADFSLPDRR